MGQTVERGFPMSRRSYHSSLFWGWASATRASAKGKGARREKRKPPVVWLMTECSTNRIRSWPPLRHAQGKARLTDVQMMNLNGQMMISSENMYVVVSAHLKQLFLSLFLSPAGFSTWSGRQRKTTRWKYAWRLDGVEIWWMMKRQSSSAELSSSVEALQKPTGPT